MWKPSWLVLIVSTNRVAADSFSLLGLENQKNHFQDNHLTTGRFVKPTTGYYAPNHMNHHLCPSLSPYTLNRSIQQMKLLMKYYSRRVHC